MHSAGHKRRWHTHLVGRTPILPVYLALALANGLAPAAAWAEETPPPSMAIDGAELILNGYGDRELWWISAYRCALYLPTRSADVAYITDAGTAKVLQIHILYGDIPDSMPADWRALFADKLSDEMLKDLAGAYAKLEKDDRLTFAYAPSGGTKIFVNKWHILTDPGHGLMDAILNQWLGAQPVSQSLRRRLLDEPERAS